MHLTIYLTIYLSTHQSINQSIRGAAPMGGQRSPWQASATHSKIGKTLPRAAGPLAGNGCETRACSERPPGEVPRGPVDR